MTIRQILNNGKRKITIAISFGAGVIIVSPILNPKEEYSLFIMLLLVAVVLVVIFRISFHCPKCKSSWAPIAMYSGGPFSISKRIIFCPYCGVDVDSELEGG
jgi:hypothetical protein